MKQLNLICLPHTGYVAKTTITTRLTNGQDAWSLIVYNYLRYWTKLIFSYDIKYKNCSFNSFGITVYSKL